MDSSFVIELLPDNEKNPSCRLAIPLVCVGLVKNGANDTRSFGTNMPKTVKLRMKVILVLI